MSRSPVGDFLKVIPTKTGVVLSSRRFWRFCILLKAPSSPLVGMPKENLPTQSTIAPCSRKLSKISQKQQKRCCKVSSLHSDIAEGGLARLPRCGIRRSAGPHSGPLTRSLLDSPPDCLATAALGLHSQRATLIGLITRRATDTILHCDY